MAVTTKSSKAVSKCAKETSFKCSYSTDGAMVYSILGGMIGDIAGSTREGYGSKVVAVKKLLTSNSTFTDDTCLMVAVADWLNNRDKTTVSECLLKWGRRYPNTGYGTLSKVFLKEGVAQSSIGNGGAMRVAPCAIIATSIEEAIKLAEHQCMASHTTDIAKDGAKSIAASIFIAREGRLNGKSAAEVKSEVKSFVEEHFGYDLNKSLSEIQAESRAIAEQRAICKASGDPTMTYPRISSSALSCPMAIMAFLMGESFEESLKYAIAMLGDSDSIACMAGSISAQFYGIPQQLVEEALIYLPSEMIAVLNEFENTNFEPSRIAPPYVGRWLVEDDVVVFGAGVGNGESESGSSEVFASRFNRHSRCGYPILTIGKTLEEIESGVEVFIVYAKQNPSKRFHVRKVGYDKAGYTVEQIAPLFNGAKELTNVLLPKEMLDVLNW